LPELPYYYRAGDTEVENRSALHSLFELVTDGKVAMEKRRVYRIVAGVVLLTVLILTVTYIFGGFEGLGESGTGALILV
jgi:hypothetical protein